MSLACCFAKFCYERRKPPVFQSSFWFMNILSIQILLNSTTATNCLEILFLQVLYYISQFCSSHRKITLSFTTIIFIYYGFCVSSDHKQLVIKWCTLYFTKIHLERTFLHCAHGMLSLIFKRYFSTKTRTDSGRDIYRD